MLVVMGTTLALSEPCPICSTRLFRNGGRGMRLEDLLPIAKTATLAQTWQAWQQGKLILAFLGDGSKIFAVGRPRSWVCEVHSERGEEYRNSTEMVIWKNCNDKGEIIPDVITGV
jgi:hypothetical protein